ncbi:MAG: hypothetical protein QNK04_08125 [Myxococcota bacterium]|nr:hypothetical protein [Myxococcota bacterium]
MERNRPFSRDSVAALVAFAAALGIFAPEARSDDTALFSTRVAPNVMFVVDNSGSMNQVVWHPAYVPERVYDLANCPVHPPTHEDYDPKCLPEPLCGISYNESGFDGDGGGSADRWRDTDLTFRTRNGRSGITKCSNTRDVWVDPEVKAEGNQTRWPLHYLQWYFSDNVEIDHDGDGTTILEEILATNNGDTAQCVLDQDPMKPATYPRYKRARVTAAKGILRQVICETSLVAEIRYGLAKFYNDSEPEGGYIRVPIDDYTPAHASLLETRIDELEGEQWTPLGETMYNVYRYFQSRATDKQVLGKDDDTRFPKYNLSTTGGTTSSPPGSPVTDDCQLNFVVLITDGAPTRDDFDNMNLSRFRDDLIGDYNDIPWDSADETPPNAFFSPEMDATSCGCSTCCEVGLYLDDIAKFMQEKDFQLDAAFPGKQVIDTYTVGFTTSAKANFLLKETARVGNGEFFFSNNPEELASALTATLASIVDKAFSFTAATVPASRATDGNNFFATYFRPSGTEPFWEGHLKAFEFNAAGEIRDEPDPPATQGECAVEDPLAPARCLVGRLKVELDGYWDAANGIPAPGSRDLYVSLNTSSRPTPVPPTTPADFDTSLTTTELDFSGLGLSIADLSEFSVAGDISDIDDDDELKDAIVEYLMGCEFDDDSCTDRGDGNKLWDLFHSNPVVIGPPNAGLREVSYRDFVDRYKHRKRVIVGGSNGGFVHGFNAGEYDNTMADSYDRGDGTEEWGFMTWWARKKIADLPRTVSPKQLNMDGSPVASDVWLYPAANLNPDDVVSNAWNRWRTVLLGGMREGGRVYYALDVTNPPDHDSPGGEQASGPSAYPGYLWEFPCESTAAQCIGTGVVPAGRSYLEYMGETWSEPVVTRVKVRLTDTCVPEPCPTYDRWVAIFGAGYDTKGDPNHPDYDGTFTAATSRAGRAIFMVDITTGEVLAWRRFDHAITDPDLAMQYAFAASPAVFDLNRDGYADVAYFGDLGGNLWKWVISDDIVDPINGTETDERHLIDLPGDPDGWKFFKFFSAEDCGPIEGCTGASPAPTPHFRSFFFPPAGALVGAKLYLVFGSGERNHLDFVSTIDAEKNRLYVVQDFDPLERETALPLSAFLSRYSDSNLVPASSMPGSCIPPTGKVGFFIQGDHGEKFITNAEIFFGLVLTGSFVPTIGGSTCDNAGQGYLYGFDLFCGTGALPDPGGGGGKVPRVSVGAGLPSRPRVSVGPVGDGGGGGGDCKDMVVVITSEGEAFSDCPGGRPDSGVLIKSWRDEN